MKMWMAPWLVPLLLLATVSFSAASTLVACILWLVLGWVVIPFGVGRIVSSRKFTEGSETPELDTSYWRIKPL